METRAPLSANEANVHTITFQAHAQTAIPPTSNSRRVTERLPQASDSAGVTFHASARVRAALEDFWARQRAREKQRQQRQAGYYETRQRREANGTAGTIRPHYPGRRI